MLRIRHLFLSPGHNFFDHYGRPANTHPVQKAAEAECVAGYSLKDDRFYGYRPDDKSQVVFFAAEVFAGLRERFGVPALSPRRAPP